MEKSKINIKNKFDLNYRTNNIIIDTNILVYMYENKKDVFDFVNNKISNANFFVLDKTIDEINKIFLKKTNKLRLIKNYLIKLENINKFKFIKVSDSLFSRYKDVDSILVYFSKKYIIFTNDKLLKQKIKRKNGMVLSLGTKDVFIN